MKLSEIKKGFFLKYLSMMHLVKFFKHEKNRIILHSFFSLSNRPGGKLVQNYEKVYEPSFHLIQKHLRPMNDNEIRILRKTIESKYPDFCFERLLHKNSSDKNKKYIEHLKREGYIILKEM